MSLLTLIERVVNETGVSDEPEVVVTSTSRDVRQLLSILYRVGNDLKVRPWPVLNKLATITLVADQEAYAHNDDFDYEIFNTHWDVNSRWPVNGPYTAQEWQELKNGAAAASAFRRKYRVRSYRDKRFYIDPTPTDSEAGHTLTYEYQSLNWIRPKTWTTLTAFSAGAYCFYDGYFFTTSLSGVTGATPPTPSNLNDGGITWSEVYTYPTFTADTDEFLLNEELVGLGVQWNYLAAKGLPYAHLEVKYARLLDIAYASSRGAEILDLRGPEKDRYPFANVPETIPY